MRLYRTICRVDYKVSFAEMDNLGKHTQFFYERTTSAPFADVQCSLDVPMHVTRGHGKVDGRPFKFNFGPKNIDFTIEYPEGLDVDRVGKTPLFDLMAELVPKLAPKHQFERIGIRSFVIATAPTLKFRPVLDLLLDRLGSLREPFVRGFTPKDIGCVIELDDRQGRHGRGLFGPYQNKEWAKHFEQEPKVNPDEGLIFDIDTSIANHELHLDLARFASAHAIMIREVGGGLASRLEQELQ